jgi:hypothetical protein
VDSLLIGFTQIAVFQNSAYKRKKMQCELSVNQAQSYSALVFTLASLTDPYEMSYNKQRVREL